MCTSTNPFTGVFSFGLQFNVYLIHFQKYNLTLPYFGANLFLFINFVFKSDLPSTIQFQREISASFLFREISDSAISSKAKPRSCDFFVSFVKFWNAPGCDATWSNKALDGNIQPGHRGISSITIFRIKAQASTASFRDWTPIFFDSSFYPLNRNSPNPLKESSVGNGKDDLSIQGVRCPKLFPVENGKLT